jgi:uncharacterized membrane protein
MPLRQSGGRLTRQRGAAAVFAAISITALLAAVALVIDIGQLYFTQRDLQNKANLAALDAVRESSGCYSVVVDAASTAEAAARSSLLRNGGNPEWLEGGGVRLGLPGSGADGLRFFRPETADFSSAVEVRLTRPAPMRLFPVVGGDGRQLRASAAATAMPTANIAIGSYGARVNPTAPNTLLSFLPANVSLSAGAYNALVDAEVSLFDIPVPGSLTEVSEFIEERIPLSTFLDLMVDALVASGELVAASAVEAIAAASDVTQMVVPADFISIGDDVAPLLGGVTFSAADLVMGALQSVLVQSAIELLVELGGGREILINIIEAVQVNEGPAGTRPGGEALTEVGTAQVRLQTRAFSLAPLLPTELLLTVEAARASAAITGIRCPQANRPVTEVRVRTQTSVTSIDIKDIVVPVNLATLAANLGVPIPPLLSAIANTLSVNVKVLVDGPVLLPGEPVEDWYPEPFPNAFSVSSPLSAPLSDLVLGRISVEIEAPVLGGLNAVLNPVLQLLTSTLTATLETAVGDIVGTLVALEIDPLLAALGVSVAGADVEIRSVDVKPPQLFVTR